MNANAHEDVFVNGVEISQGPKECELRYSPYGIPITRLCFGGASFPLSVYAKRRHLNSPLDDALVEDKEELGVVTDAKHS